jgi:carbamoyltransferase
MKETINAKRKRRESFRPFAPSVLREDVATYFEQQLESPFMMHVVKIRPEWRDRLPAVTHGQYWPVANRRPGKQSALLQVD